VAKPSDRQLEKHIKQSAQDSGHVVFTTHARQRMRQRYLNDPMVLEVLRQGVLATTPEPDMKHQSFPAHGR
jgi:ABC-type transport system involved in cytochrome c biogenesis ATPase subunit